MSYSPGQPWRRIMHARDRNEAHRSATPLELLFDLCFVVAVAQVAQQLHHGLAEGDLLRTVVGYLAVFFAIWWAWMNFTWFASAFDTDDVPYRLLTLLQIVGVLILAAGVPSAFNAYDFRIAVVGYVVMRSAMVAQWLRAAHDYPPVRPTALRFALGISLCQIAWVVRLGLPEPWNLVSFPVLAVLEMSVPVWAESAGEGTAWHPEHIAERYGLFTLIVLGECVLAATNAIQSGLSESGVSAGLLMTAGGAILLIFGLWWSYFKIGVADGLRRSGRYAFVWGYGHYVVFASIAALGAGLALATEAVLHVAHVSDVMAAFTVAIPVALYLVTVALLHWPVSQVWRTSIGFIVLDGVLILLLAASAQLIPLPLAVLLMGVATAGLVAFHVTALYRSSAPARSEHAAGVSLPL